MNISKSKKAIMLISDGLGDRPIPEFGGKTPLEYAHKPTIDVLCDQGCAGLVHPYQAGARCGTDWGHLCLFGYNPEQYYTGRGSIEAASAGIVLYEGDVAFRGNFATVDEGLKVIDRRAGRISETEDISSLLSCVDGMEIDGCKFIVKPLTEHRLALVINGKDLYGKIKDTDPGTAQEGAVVKNPVIGCNAQERRTAELLWKFLQETYKRWQNHPVNIARKQKGLLQANFILTRGSGAAMVLPPFQTQFPGVKVACVAGDETIVGISQMCGFDGYTQKDFTGSFETNYLGKAALALKLMEKYDLVIVHVKATDLCGHDNLPDKKASVVEKIDEMFKYWVSNTDRNSTYFVMTADHSTPCAYREHSADPVPTFFYGPDVRRDSVTFYGERSCVLGMLNNYTGAQLMATIMDYLGFAKKYGA